MRYELDPTTSYVILKGSAKVSGFFEVVSVGDGVYSCFQGDTVAVRNPHPVLTPDAYFVHESDVVAVVKFFEGGEDHGQED